MGAARAGRLVAAQGEYLADEQPLAAARREFAEELGIPVPDVDLVELGEVRQPSGKLVTVWAGESDLDLAGFAPGTFEMEWPRGSGRAQSFPEIDRVAWFDLADCPPFAGCRAARVPRPSGSHGSTTTGAPDPHSDPRLPTPTAPNARQPRRISHG